MALTGNTYEKWFRGDNTVNIQGMIMALVHSNSICFPLPEHKKLTYMIVLNCRIDIIAGHFYT